ncbi:hypothetical protein COCC4DRAFT_29842 [Bipolaris maydis ATCC 48331]|uniref:Uncharacterized protein n=2 Tax=Cochliobolus heterostrophus TaxID=5016 RepID=M2UP73_COCH5|nr:uncharacterized protein COCC4DRAFT_29842 [Bipolaris maydis ATCC 48331]EMD89748.1 hypothetical protein COCHEDRAFT_1022001 [Bipolaris maydis C5]ENI10038.1 hypothetical protein COCC4DRAFT_29842 [Bipolaris maydis ATCC 48331]
MPRHHYEVFGHTIRVMSGAVLEQTRSTTRIEVPDSAQNVSMTEGLFSYVVKDS